ncbi:MAG TPA: reverse transcriptase domain-containing protein [Terriglobia bacterium]|nr:reverse transcriptase domain-containing protein [Terriglobia bacterium]
MQPPLITFKNISDLKKSLLSAGQLSKDDDRRFEKLAGAKLPPLLSPTVFGIVLGISPKLITAMAKHPRRDYPYYRTFQIPKKSGGKRTILAPRRFLKAVQKYILRQILESQPLPSCVTGFVRKRGVLGNAALHVGCRYILNVDIQDFFPSVTEEHVVQVFAGLGYSKTMSRILGRLCTYDRALPQGAPTSPSLANLVFKRVDLKLTELAQRQELKYSRYADDLTFSGLRPIEDKFLKRVAGLLNQHGFRLNVKKTRFAKPGQPRYVTGFVVNKKVQPCRDQRRRIRAMFHNASRHPAKFQRESAVLLGWASFVRSYDRAKGKEYMRIAQKVATTAAKAKGRR